MSAFSMARSLRRPGLHPVVAARLVDELAGREALLRVEWRDPYLMLDEPAAPSGRTIGNGEGMTADPASSL